MYGIVPYVRHHTLCWQQIYRFANGTIRYIISKRLESKRSGRQIGNSA